MATHDTPRRRALQAMLVGLMSLGLRSRLSEAAEEVPWLSEVDRALADAPRESAERLEPLLTSVNGSPIRSVEDWQPRRAELRRRWLEFLGPMPEQRPDVVLDVLKEDHPQGCVRQLVRYESEPDQPVEGYLLRPEGMPPKGGWPGIVGLHQTTNASIDEIAGVSGPEAMQIGLALCRRGFVVMCPRCFLWQNVESLPQAVERFRERHPQTRGMHKMLYDAMRGVDVLASLPEVNATRIGATGHSLGAKETLYLAAFDERIRAAVASEGGLTLGSTNWDAPWYLGPKIREPEFDLNHHQLLALIAPRPFLILAGEEGRGAADGEHNWPLIEAGQAVYRLYDESPRLGMYNHRQGHALPPVAFQRLAQWLEAYV